MSDLDTDLPLTEFDPDREALIAPRPPALREPMPARVVMCFFPEVLAGLTASHAARRIGAFPRDLGGHEIHLVEAGGEPVAVFHPGVGAPLAAHHLEQAIAAGGRAFVACGGAGALRAGMALGHVVVPDAAVRDEGTSYHYAPPARVVRADPATVAACVDVLAERAVPYTIGMTWTTDAPLRETPARIRARRDEGCITVEMETAAFLTVAAFRGVRLTQYLYAGDDVSGSTWSHRNWTSSSGVRAGLLDLALAAVRRLPL
ncbi:nucleoside phosphorylase [Dactylosporangium sp. NPDC000555]|uniref:nucleoside phosphorylase n=1 Tax=Dactylosporangium sp. NPDC000555 TaxID=3154260 RepID=UPI003329A6B7